MAIRCSRLYGMAISFVFTRRVPAFGALLMTALLLVVMHHTYPVAKEYRATLGQRGQDLEALLIQWRQGSIPVTTADIDRVVSAIKTDLTPLLEVEDLLLEFGNGSLDSWKLLQEIRKLRVQLACTNQFLSTGHQPPNTKPHNATAGEVTADHIRTEKQGLDNTRIPEIGDKVHAIEEMQRETDPPSLAYIVANRKNLLSHFMVDDRNKYIYCYIPKVACTQWKKVMMFTADTADKPFQDISHIDVHYKNKLPLLSDTEKYSDIDVLERLADYTKLMVVRSPLERLVSAYQDKFLSNAYDAAAFKKNYARNMIKAVRGEDVETGDGMQFKEFLQYLSSGYQKPGSFQEHWKPMYDLCHPCSINYDFIAKFSTLEDDSNRILDNVIQGIERQRIEFPKVVPSKTPEILEEYLAEIDPALLEAVKRIYMADHEMFGY